ncbi:hypothetical protein H7Y63_01445 [Polaromonas sp.]|nr:hypothetical protein [Candidatus Saccharibacteria bacterium]
MKVPPFVPIIFLIGIFINSLGRLLLLPLLHPVGLTFTTVGYLLWAAAYLYITVCALITKQFNRHIAFWLVFTILAPIQFSAARDGNDAVNHITAAILVSQLVIGSIWETKLYLQRRK